MTPDRWQQVQELFDQAMDRPTSERAAFLSEACGPDSLLQTEVASLITADENAGDFISTPALGEDFVLPDAEALLDEEVARPMRERIGAYRVVRLIASGGVGAVYLAERDDGQFQKRAAPGPLLISNVRLPRSASVLRSSDKSESMSACKSAVSTVIVSVDPPSPVPT